jgi:AcrR family transcriptional regulator
MLARESYRHGDLRQALLDAALEMAREGGPDAVVLREATRRAGVSPNAAYRHFADRTELVEAVSDTAQSLVAGAIETEWNAVPATLDATTSAHAHLRAVGRGYLAFTVPSDLDTALAPEKAGPGGRTSFQLLSIALDELVAVGALPPERRPGAEFSAWSAVHGLAMLVLEGPLRDLDPEVARGAGARLIDMVDRGL